MPHLIVEYTRPLEEDMNIQGMVQDVFEAADASGLFTTASIKVRALALDHYVNGGHHTPFIHVHIRVFPGRTADQKKKLNQAVFEVIKKQATPSLAVSVDVRELDSESYVK